MSKRKRIVIVGGGVAALETAIGLHENELVDVDVTLVSPNRNFNYRPFAVLEPFGFSQAVEMPIAELVADCHVELVSDKVSRVDLAFRRVMTSRGDLIEFDALLVASGAEPVEGLRGAVTVGDAAGNMEIERLLLEIDAGLVKSVAFVASAGASWTLPIYEIALLTAAHAKRHLKPAVRVMLVTAERRPLQIFGDDAADHIQQLLDRAGVEFLGGVQAQTYGDGRISTATGDSIPADRAVALPHLVGRRIPGLPHDSDGFLPVDSYGQVVGTDGIYAAGDISDFPVKQGSIAAQQADAVISSIAASFGEKQAPRPFQPQLHALLLSDRASTFIRASDDGALRKRADVSDEPLWEDSEKIFSRHLSQRMQRLRAAGTKLAAR